MNLDFIAYPLGKFLLFIYNTLAFNNYGLSLILFTVIVKLAMLPLTIKQLKSTTQMQLLQPQIQDIQRKYKTDREKLNQETMKLYSEHKINPAGGCLPLLIQLPILMSLYWVIVQPLKFMLGKTAEQIDALVAVATGNAATATVSMDRITRELTTLNFFNENQDALSQVTGMLSKSELIDFNFLGLQLGQIASYKPDVIFSNPKVYLPLLLLTLFGVAATYFATKLGMPKPKTTGNRPASQQNDMASSMTKSMTYMGPIMTLFFSFSLPAGVVLYWAAGYVFQIFQQLFINKKILGKAQAPIERRTGGKAAEAISAQAAQTAQTVEEVKVIETAGVEGKASSSLDKVPTKRYTVQKSGGSTDKQDKYADRKKGGGKKK